MPVKEVPVKEGHTSLSSVFDYEDDALVLEILSRKKEEAEMIINRTVVRGDGRKRKSMIRMAEFSYNLVESIQDSSNIDKLFKVSKSKKLGKINDQTGDTTQKKIKKYFKSDREEGLEETCDFTPSLDEILKLPEMLDGGKSKDEVLDDMDVEIAERKKRHDEEMGKVDIDITAEKGRQEERRERMKRNAVDRDRLEVEMTEPVLKKMFSENLQYLKNIQSGVVESARHQAYHKSYRTRHALYYKMITDPFTDSQLDWTLEELGKVWMRTRKEQMDNNDYVWKVLLAECFIKFVMDMFDITKNEAEKKIAETPLKGEEDSSDEL